MPEDIELPDIPDVDASGGEDSGIGIDLSSFGEDSEPEPSNSGQPDSGSQPESGGDNPAWSSILEALPEPFHEKVKPLLKEWDRGVNSKFQDIHSRYEPYKPYEEFVKQNVSIDDLKQAWAAAQVMEQNPLEYHRRLTEYLESQGVLQPSTQKNSGTEDTEDIELDDLDSEDPVAKQLALLQSKQQQLEATLREKAEREALEQAQREADQRLDQEIAELEKKHGKFSKRIRDEVFSRALAKAQLENRYVPLSEAFDDMIAFVSEVRKNRPQPPKLPGGGGVPVPESDTIDEKNRKQVAAEFIKSMIEGNRQG